MRIMTIALTSLSLLCGCSGSPDDGSPDATAEGTLDQASAPGDIASTELSEEPGISDSASGLTAPQMNAVRSAEQYLAMTGFSRAGLIEQLSSDAGDGYSLSDATAAVDSLSVDWNENAVKSARQYLSMTGFSCNGLVEQLSSSAGDRYTVEQATFGAQHAGAC